MKKGIILAVILILSIIIPNKIKADTYVRGIDTPWKNGSGTLLPKNGPYHYDTKTSNSSGGANQAYQVSEFYLNSSEQVDITTIKGGTVEIPFYISATVVKGQSSEVYTCTEYKQSGNMYTCNYLLPSTINGDYYVPQINVWTMIVYNNGYTDMCTIDLANNKIRCPIAQMSGNNKIWFIQVRTQVYYTDNYPSQYYFVGLGDKVNLFKNDFVSLEENNNNNTQSILDANTTYDTNSTAYTNETTTINDMEQAQDQLMDSLDFSIMDDLNITVNPNASTFIWEIANRLRSMNGAIVLLITSMLSMGIIKMVLNR